MGEQTEIGWTDHTFNPWWGCVKLSPGCRFCYADSLSSRYGHDVWGAKKPRRMLSEGYWLGPEKWNAEAAAGVPGVRGVGSHLVFCASMADVFEDRPDLVGPRARLFDLIAETPSLDWQLLTKRIDRVADLVPWGDDWPANVWLGTSVEDQRRADERIPHLLRIPAAVRFLSVEPLLGPVALALYLGFQSMIPELWREHVGIELPPDDRGIGWVIVGGESGPRHRPFDLDWARSLRDECLATSTPFYFKQVGGHTNKAGGRLLDGRTWDEFPTGVAVNV